MYFLQATAAADSILKEKNKEKLKGKYTEVMQQLEQCSNVLFLINSSLPGDAGKVAFRTPSEHPIWKNNFNLVKVWVAQNGPAEC